MKILAIFYLTAVLFQAQSSTATVQGTITHAATGEPLRDVRVTLRQTATTAAPVPPRSTISDSDGRFIFNDLPSGRYTVSVAHDGFSTSPANTSDVTVNAGMTVNVRLSLIPDGVVRGRVLDPAGKLVTNAMVQAFTLVHQNGTASLRSVASRVTDDRGEYRLFGIAPGDYYIAATPPQPILATAAGVGSVRNTGTFYPSSTNAADATTLTVGAGQDLSAIDIVLQSNLQVTVSGRVVNGVERPPSNAAAADAATPPLLTGTEDPISSANLTLLRRTSEGVDLPDPETSTRVVLKGIAADFEIHGVAPGEYDLFALMATPEGFHVGRMPVSVVDRDVPGVTLIVQRGVDLHGIVTMDGNSVSQLPYMSLQSTDSLSRIGFGVTVQPRTDVRGGFTATGIPEGHFRLSPILPTNAYVDDIIQSGLSVYDSGFNVHSASSSDALEVRLKTGAATVEGVVSGANERPLAGVTVAIVPTAKRSNPTLFRSVLTDPAGRFTLNGIAPGEYKLFAWTGNINGAYFDPAFLGKYEDDGRVITVQPNSRSAVRLHALDRR